MFSEIGQSSKFSVIDNVDDDLPDYEDDQNVDPEIATIERGGSPQVSAPTQPTYVQEATPETPSTSRPGAQSRRGNRKTAAERIDELDPDIFLKGVEANLDQRKKSSERTEGGEMVSFDGAQLYSIDSWKSGNDQAEAKIPSSLDNHKSSENASDPSFLGQNNQVFDLASLPSKVSLGDGDPGMSHIAPETKTEPSGSAHQFVQGSSAASASSYPHDQQQTTNTEPTSNLVQADDDEMDSMIPLPAPAPQDSAAVLPESPYLQQRNEWPRNQSLTAQFTSNVTGPPYMPQENDVWPRGSNQSIDHFDQHPIPPQSVQPCQFPTNDSAARSQVVQQGEPPLKMHVPEWRESLFSDMQPQSAGAMASNIAPQWYTTPEESCRGNGSFMATATPPPHPPVTSLAHNQSALIFESIFSVRARLGCLHLGCQHIHYPQNRRLGVSLREQFVDPKYEPLEHEHYPVSTSPVPPPNMPVHLDYRNDHPKLYGNKDRSPVSLPTTAWIRTTRESQPHIRYEPWRHVQQRDPMPFREGMGAPLEGKRATETGTEGDRKMARTKSSNRGRRGAGCAVVMTALLVWIVMVWMWRKL